MTLPGGRDLARTMMKTWPSAGQTRVGRFTVGHGQGGGNRVSAARMVDLGDTGENITETDLGPVIREQKRLGQEFLFAVFDWQTALDQVLEQEGFTIRDATDMLACPIDAIAAAPPAVTCFDVWPPLAAQEEIWADGGIGPSRLSIMARAPMPKTTLFGRTADKPAGSAFVAIEGGIAMLHALEVLGPLRRKGLARTMTCAAADWARQRGALVFSVLVTQQNDAARALYRSMGMQKVASYHYRVAPR